MLEVLSTRTKKWLKGCLNCACTLSQQATDSEYFKQQLQDCLLGKKFLLEKVETQRIQITDLQAKIFTPQPLPKTSGELSYLSLKKLLKDKTKALFLSDQSYKLIYLQSMKEFLANDDTDSKTWIKQYHDCDDFSYRLMGQASTPEWACLAFGIAWSKTHAFNIFVSANKNIYLIEPQSDKVIKLEDATGAYSNIQLIVM